MQIGLYNNTENNNVIGKRPTLLLHIDGVHVKEDSSQQYPTLILRNIGTDEEEDSLIKCNYVHIPRWRRWYYITNKVFLTGGRVQLECRCDVLESFKSDIKNTKAFVERSGSARTRPYLIDNELPIDSRRTIENKQVGEVGETINFVITVTGGVE